MFRAQRFTVYENAGRRVIKHPACMAAKRVDRARMTGLYLAWEKWSDPPGVRRAGLPDAAFRSFAKAAFRTERHYGKN